MRAIGHILRSYVQRRFVLLLLLLAASYCLIAAAALTGRHPKAAWCFFLYAFVFVAAMPGIHLRQMIESSAVDLLPRYRAYQLMAAGIILAALLIWPVLLTGYLGVPVLNTLAAFLSFACMVIWISFFFENGLMIGVGILAVWWLFVDIYRLMGLSPDISRLGQLGGYIGSFWPIYMIAASAFGLLLFVFYFTRTPGVRSPGMSKTDFRQALETQDWIDPIAVKSVAKKISRLAGKRADTKPSLFRLIRLFQFSLFSPSYTGDVFYSLMSIFLLCALLVYLSFHAKNSSDIPAMNFYLPFACYWLTTILAADFLSHRNRMPAIYLQSSLPSRNSFRRTAALTLLLVVGKHMLGITLAMIIFQMIFPWTSWANVIPSCLMGLALSCLQVSLSLLASNWMPTPAYSTGWLIINVFAIIPIKLLVQSHRHPWISIGAIALLAGLLLIPALRNWTRSEMDFAVN